MMKFHDKHSVTLSSNMNAIQFTRRVLDSRPKWLDHILLLRDAVVKNFGFAVQQNSHQASFDITEGATAGPFCFKAVSSELVSAGNGDKHISFISTFTTKKVGDVVTGYLETNASSRTRIGIVYLLLIWPIHKLLMQYLLRRAARYERM